ncbi:MAG: DUF262 domain-containing protein [Candidatus Woesearchaeota archaeon]
MKDDLKEGYKPISIKELLKIYSELGIPHFQRGLVWDNEKKAKFIRSLYNKYPIGMFVLWKIDSNLELNSLGIGLKNEENYKYLIIDGQQRIRTLNEVFNENYENQENRIACFNVKEKKIHYLKDPKQYKDNSRYKKNWVPIKILIKYYKACKKLKKTKETKEDILKGYEFDVDKKLLSKLILDYGEEFHDILNQKLPLYFFSSKVEQSEVTKAYNAINSGGIKATKEELAYAELINSYGDSYKSLEKCFETLHGTLKVNRETILERKREQALGFKFIIRVLVLIINNNKSIGSRELSFDYIINKKIRAGKVKRAWRKIKHILKKTRKLIVDYLYCDDFRFIPDSITILPFVEYCIKNKDISEETYKKWAKYTLKMYLAGLNQKEIFRIINDIKDKKEYERLFTNEPLIFEYKSSVREKIKSKIRDLEKLKDKEKNPLFQTRTPNNRYLLMLYWLIRKESSKKDDPKDYAKDFNYKNNGLPSIKNEKIIDKNSNPEKAHLVPFSKFSVDDNLEHTRSNHISYHIGNMTYLSHDLNCGIDQNNPGIANNFPNLDNEKKENLDLHFIDEDFIKSFNEIKKEYESTNENNKKKLSTKDKKFIEMCNKRAVKIGKAFLEWINEK